MNNYFYNQFARESKKPFIVIVSFEDFGRIETIAFGKMGQAERWMARRLDEIEASLDIGAVVTACIYHCPTKTLLTLAEVEGKFAEKYSDELREMFGEDF